MANTLKFGNGEWYGKKDTILAYNDENSNYKPLPFDFSRASKATVINKDGLIEEVGSGQPRVDYKDDTKGAMLLEPSRTNKVTYSDDFSQWTDYNASAVLSEETIYGKNAYKIVEDNTTNYHGVYLSNLFTADGTNYIWSAYVKGAERRYVVLTSRTGISSNASAIIFDTQEGQWVLDASSQNEALFAENVGNGWWRIAIEGDPTSGAYDSYTIASAIGFSSYLDANYQGDGTSGFYVAMAQVEVGSYATSYIPTSGSAVTRLAEVCSQTVPDSVIGQTEGTLFAEFEYFGNTSGALEISPIYIGTGTYATAIYADIYQGELYAVCFNSGVNQASINCGVLSVGTHKVAIGYSNNDIVIYLDGLLGGSDTSATIPECNRVYLGTVGTSTSVQKYTQSEAKLYNTRLSNSELQALTQV